MSRSRQHNPITGCCNGSDKQDKRIANRRLRHRINRVLKRGIGVASDAVYPIMREVSSIWAFTKDGKQYLKPELRERYMRK